MGEPTKHLDHFIIAINGANLDEPHMKNILNIEVDDSLYMPDMFSIYMTDPDLQALHQDVFKLGSEIKISVQTRQDPNNPSSGLGAPVVLMKGEITSIEPDLNSTDRTTLTVRGYDRSHKLTRVRKTQTYLQMTDSDIAKKLAAGAGLQPQVTGTNVVYKYVMQANQTDWEFLMERAARIGFRLFVEDRTLYFQPPPPSPPETPLEWGMDLSRFRPRLTTMGQVSEVKVYGWDPKAKSKIVGQASSPGGGLLNRKDNGKSGGASAHSAHSVNGKIVVVDRPVYNQGEADKMAAAILDSREGNFIQAEAEAGGNPNLRAGTAAKVDGVGPRFGGKYLITRSVHRYNQQGYTTRFWCSGGNDSMSISSLLQSGHSSSSNVTPSSGGSTASPGSVKPTAMGVMVGIVTNNADPENLGRVKVKFPMLPDATSGTDTESWWCRLATPMAGPTQGIAFFPEANDEVLVAFLNGDPNHGYVLGAVWNGSDKLPKPLSRLVTGGKTIRRVIRTRVGHEMMFDDTSEATRGITLIDKTEKDFIKIITAPDDKIIIECHKDVEINAQTGDVSVDAKLGKVNVKSMGNMDMQSASGNLSIKATGKVSITGTAGVDITSPAITNVKGSIVNIN